jgi:hypothetical protein
MRDSPTERRRSSHHTMSAATIEDRHARFELLALG